MVINMDKKELKIIIEKQMKLNDGFVSNNNYKLVDIDENYCELEGIITETSLNPYGIAHGGYIFGLDDTAAGIAARAKGRNAVTVSSSISYIRMAKGNKIIAIAKCLKEGKNISNYEVEILDEDNKIIAKVLIEYYYI